ncbi:MAG: HAD-IA family hydrolase [Alphaproteobacteria bacterium]
MPLLQGLIFDLDGTLLDSAPDLCQALNLTLKDHNHGELTLDEVKDMTGDGMLPMLGRAFAATGERITEANSYKLFQEFIQHYRTLKPDPSQLYPGTVEMLEKYHAKGVKLGICTNKQEAATHRLIADLNLTPYFTFIAGGDTYPTHKPHPDHVRGVIAELRVPAMQCVMIGDSRNDVLAAKGAGIPCIGITHGYGIALDQLGANLLISGFNELPQALDSLGFQLS